MSCEDSITPNEAVDTTAHPVAKFLAQYRSGKTGEVSFEDLQKVLGHNLPQEFVDSFIHTDEMDSTDEKGAQGG